MRTPSRSKRGSEESAGCLPDILSLAIVIGILGLIIVGGGGDLISKENGQGLTFGALAVAYFLHRGIAGMIAEAMKQDSRKS